MDGHAKSRASVTAAERYVPTHVDGATWVYVASPVRAIVARVTDSEPSALKVLAVLAGFAAWQHREGINVDESSLADAELVERYVQTGMAGSLDSTRATRRSILRRVVERLDPTSRQQPEQIAYRRVKPPYTAAEVAGFFSQATAQPTVARRLTINSTLLLGLGCGLDRSDLAWVRGCDVTVSARRPGVVVAVVGGPRPRAVVALAEYESQLAEAARAAGSSLMIGGSRLGRHNVTTPALDRMITDTRLPRLSAARLRSTWLTRHLQLGTPLHVLLPAAGVASARLLDDLLPFVDAPAGDKRALLRGVAS